MNVLRRFAAGILLAVGLLLHTGGLAYADVNDFTVHDFAADYTLTNLDPQGKLSVIERIDLTFTDNNHGIERAIPKSYKDQSVHIDDIAVTGSAPGQFSTYDSGGNLVIRIGDPNRTVTGRQQYEIRYSLKNVIGLYEQHDEFYWNINGTQWQQPFEHVSMALHLPEAVSLSERQPLCYSGIFGSKAQDCALTVDEKKKTIMLESTKPLNPNETLSVVVGFNKGFFRAPTTAEKLWPIVFAVAQVATLPLVVLAYAVKRWRKEGRDPAGRGVIIPEYDSPDGLSPLEVGVISDFTADNRDISATIIDLAIRKYLKIIETTKKKILKDKTTYSFELLKNDFAGLRVWEVTLVSALFPAGQVGDVTELSSLQKTFYKTAESMRKTVTTHLTTQGYFPRDPATAGAGMLIPGVLLLFTAMIVGALTTPYIGVGMAVSAVIFFVFSAFMRSRTAKGVAAKEHMEGLKLYLSVAEKERITQLQAPNAPYAVNHAEPKKTVHLFEKLLPFAMVLGVEKAWADQFKSIYVQPPDWYGGNWSTFNAAVFASHLSTGLAPAMNTAFSPPQSSSGSGFSGGGFSGGGGGGGGGGGW